MMNAGGSRGYHRVPTGSSTRDDMATGTNEGSQNFTPSRQLDDSLHQSLLMAEDGASPQPSPQVQAQQQQQQQQQAQPQFWHSPPQLHGVLERFVEYWNLIFPYIRRMGNFLFCITIFTMLVVVPMVTYTAIQEHRFDFAAFDSAGVMVLGTLVLSFRLVYLHLTHWYMPEVQKYVVRIVWMVPLYAVQSWLSLRFRGARIYIDAVRDLYEAFVIASFLYYLIELLGGQEALVRTLESKRETSPNLGKHSWPFNYLLHDWSLGMEFMLQCKHGVLQYVVVKTIATILTYMFEITEVYGEGEFRWNVAYPYMACIMNMSVMYALYVLVKLFYAVHDELQHPINWRPIGKFLCVKGVVFFTWWQGVGIFFLESKGLIPDTGSWTGDEIANALINYCICVEMVFFAIAHSYTFSYKEYLPSSIPIEYRNLTENAMTNANANNPNAPLRLQPSRSSISNTSANSGLNLNRNTSSSSLNPTYRPPAVLDRPLNFREAFWSSTIPRETMEDIQRLRNGVDSFVRGENPVGSISLREIQTEAEAVAADASATGNTAQALAAAEVASAALEAARASSTPPRLVTETNQVGDDIEQANISSIGSSGRSHTTR